MHTKSFKYSPCAWASCRLCKMFSQTFLPKHRVTGSHAKGSAEGMEEGGSGVDLGDSHLV